MSKLSKIQKEELRQCVIDSTIKRLSLSEMQQYVKQKTNGLEMSTEYLRHLRASIKKDSEKELNLYKKDRFAFLNAIFFDRVEELKYMQKTLHKVIENNQDDGDIQIKAVNQLQSITTELFNYYRRVPQVAEVGAKDVSELFPSTPSLNNNNPNNNNIILKQDSDDDSFYCERCQKRHLKRCDAEEVF